MRKIKRFFTNVISNRILFLVIGLILIAIITAIIINKHYGENSSFAARDVLLYSGSILAAVSSVLGIYFTIKISQENYREDARKRVLPYIAIQRLEVKYKDAFLDGLEGERSKNDEEYNNEYEEYIGSKLYLIIDEKTFSIEESLSKEQGEKIQYEPIECYNANAMYMPTCRYYPRKLVNVGIGPAVKCNINIRKSSEQAWTPSHIEMSLTPKQSIYMGIYVDGSEQKTRQNIGRFIIKITYSDIYSTRYNQETEFNVYSNGFIEQTLVDQEIIND